MKTATEKDSLIEVIRMAQESLDPEMYEMFCKVHDALISTRHIVEIDKLDD